MVLLHTLRCKRFMYRGLRHRARTLRALSPTPTPPSPHRHTHHDGRDDGLSRPQRQLVLHHLTQPVWTTAYCGLRMVDSYGHVNNAMYLELLEYGRWYYLALMGFSTALSAHQALFVVSSMSVQYIREIHPCQRVRVTAQMLPSGADKRIVLQQEIWNVDGTRLHAAAILHAALLGPREYAATLEEVRWDGSAPTSTATTASASPSASPHSEETHKGTTARAFWRKRVTPPPRVTLNCTAALAHASELTLAELESVLASCKRTYLGECEVGCNAVSAQVACSDGGNTDSAANSEGSCDQNTTKGGRSEDWLTTLSTACREWRGRARYKRWVRQS